MYIDAVLYYVYERAHTFNNVIDSLRLYLYIFSNIFALAVTANYVYLTRC